MPDLDKLRAMDNLRRAWRWIKSNPDAAYKSYFRPLYRNFAVADDALLEDLADRLKRNVYQPTVACKLFFPKPSGILRPYSLLTVEDQIVYQAAINIAADKTPQRVKRHYNTKVFGHLYAGKKSAWLYSKWNTGYKAFNDGARKAYADGFHYTASFDLTACYDSLDHNVLRHFLKKYGLDQEFCDQLTKWLEVWTPTEQGIYHNHGIPQGPLSSGLLSEVVLNHFDSLKPQQRINYHYFRYVDDIRLFAKSEKDLRYLLVDLDLMSKDVGLFPQSGKISIHKVDDIEKELKSVSNPPENAIKAVMVNQKKLFARIVALTPHYSVSDTTRFKYLLAHAQPSAPLTNRLWRIFEKHPELYKNICNYLRRYPKLPRVPAEKIVGIISMNALYPSIQAEFISAADGQIPQKQDGELARYLKKQWDPKKNQPDFLAAASTYLMRTGDLTQRQIISACKFARSWWVRATLINNADSNQIGAVTHNNLAQVGMKDAGCDVALAAGWKIFTDGVPIPDERKQWNPSGAIFLREVGLISRNTATYCGISKNFIKLDSKIPSVNWKKLLSKHYAQAEKQAVRVVALSSTNITAFVNALDVFNELLLDDLFAADRKIGGHTLGNIGGGLNESTSRFAKKYPATHTFAKCIHEARCHNDLSHPRVGKTAKPTKQIKYRFLSKAKGMLRAAVRELQGVVL